MLLAYVKTNYLHVIVKYEVSNAELKSFLKKNCFYGYRPAKVNLGLYLKKDIGELKKENL